MASTSTPRTKTPTRPQVTDEDYLNLLATRLVAMKSFEADPENAEVVTAKNLARKAVRDARKVRNTPAHKDLVTAWVAHQEAQKAKRAAQRGARKAAKVA